MPRPYGKSHGRWPGDQTDPHTESSFRTWVHHRWGRGVFPTYIEPSRGSTIGVADVMLQLPGVDGQLPVELKVGRKMIMENTGRIRPVFVRAEQILWHDTVARAGGRSCLLIGVVKGVRGQYQYPARFEAYVQPDCRHEVLKDWRKGWPIEELVRVTGEGSTFDYDAWKACMALAQPRQSSQEPAGAKIEALS